MFHRKSLISGVFIIINVRVDCIIRIHYLNLKQIHSQVSMVLESADFYLY